MGKLTERGEIVAAGGAQLADQSGDDTLKPAADTDQSAGSDATDIAGETEKDPAPEPAPGPADIPAPPVVETADDPDAGARENR